MLENRHILVIAPYAFGYTSHIKHALEKHKNLQVEIVYLDQPEFVYKNGLHKIQNFFSKIFFNKNLKKSFVYSRIKKRVLSLNKIDTVFVIRPDILDDSTLEMIKQHTKRFIAYYYDSTRRFPRKLDIIRFFDKIYSYDTRDVETHGFELLTNYIFEESTVTNYSYLFFNISTNDYRFPIIERLAEYLYNKNWDYNILIYNGSEMESEFVKTITEQKSIKEVSKLIKASKIIVEIQRTEQLGLSFRVFEALGHRRKLITTNKDVINYDFYNPNNILVLDEDNIEIPESFVKSPYKEVPDDILSKYKIDNWVKPVFDLSN